MVPPSAQKPSLKLTSKRPFTLTVEGGEEVQAESVIIATGAIAKRLNIEGDQLATRYVACAVCDGALPIFRNQPLVVIGGGLSHGRSHLSYQVC